MSNRFLIFVVFCVLLSMGSCVALIKITSDSNEEPVREIFASGVTDNYIENVWSLSLNKEAIKFATTTTTTSTTVPKKPDVKKRQIVTTTTAPVVVEVAPGSSSTGLEAMVEEVFGSEAGVAKRVISCESRWNPNARSHTNDHGLMQINATTWNKPGHHDPVADWIGRNWGGVYDPYTNLLMGKKIKDRYGWNSWACY